MRRQATLTQAYDASQPFAMVGEEDSKRLEHSAFILSG